MKSVRLAKKEVRDEPSSRFFRWMAINAAIFGIEVSTSVVFTYVPPLLLKTGFTESSMAVVMGIGPAIALFIIPKVGQLSDSTRTKFGRRRPIILVLSAMLLLACAMIPLHGLISKGLGLDLQSPLSLSILAVSTIALHCLSLVSFNPCEALLGDLLQPYPKFAPVGFMIYSATLSLGACVGFLITGINWVELFHSLVLTQDHIAFLLVFGCFLIGIVITMIVAKEDEEFCFKETESIKLVAYKRMYGIEDLDDREIENVDNVDDVRSVSNKKKQFGDEAAEELKMIVEIAKSRQERMKRKYPNLYKLGYYPFKFLSMPVEMILEIVTAPKAMQLVALADLFAWLGVNCHTLFFTDFVGQGVFEGDPKGAPNSTELLQYEEGFGLVALACFTIASCVACLYSATVQETVARKFGLRTIWVSGMGIFTLSMVGLCLTSNRVALQIFATLSGMGFVVITSVPNSVTTIYNGNQEEYYPELKNKAVRGLGQDIAILDIAFYSSQILLSLFIGSLVEYTGYAHWYIIVSGICGGISILIGWFIRYPNIQNGASDDDTSESSKVEEKQTEYRS